MTGVALVGASENSFWMKWALRNLRAYGYDGDVWPVNPRSSEVYGLPAYPSVANVPGVPTYVIMAIGAERCPEVVRQAVAKGAEQISVVADGFAERQDEAGIALQRELVDACGDSPVTLYGPNGVGFADFAAGVCLIAEPVPASVRAGPVSYISQSGALVSSGLAAIQEEGLGIDWCVSLGNAARLDLVGAVLTCVRRPTTQIVCLYLESLGRRTAELGEALDAARAAGKSVIVVKAGRSEKARRAALTHTASIAGNDRLVDAFLQRHGVIRTDSIEEMARTASVVRLVGPEPRARGVVVMGSSGGVAGLSSDLARQSGVELTDLTPGTRARIRELTSPLAFVENPFDLVGLPSSRNTTEDVYETVASDPGVALVVYPFSVVFPDDTPDNEMHRESIRMLTRVARRTGTPTLIPSLALTPWTPWITEHRFDDPSVAIVQSLDLTFAALRHVFPAQPAAAARDESVAEPGTALDEAESRERLERAGIGVVPGVFCATPDDVDAAVDGLRAPYVVKLVAEGVTHRAKVGGVRLGCQDAGEVRAAWKSIMDAVGPHGVTEDDVRGFMVEETASGTEVIVGLSRDPAFGAFLTVGHGGVDVEARAQNSVVLLPASAAELRAVLTRLAIAPAGDLTPIVELIQRLSDAFGHGALRGAVTVETNPIMLGPDGPVITDVLIVEPSTSESGKP
jgi:acetate---CoA ligase (ADP-forming)